MVNNYHDMGFGSATFANNVEDALNSISSGKSIIYEALLLACFDIAGVISINPKLTFGR